MLGDSNAGSLSCAFGMAFLLMAISLAAGSAPPEPLGFVLHWFAPFFSGSGYGSEALSFVLALHGAGVQVKITHGGDAINEPFMRGLPVSQLTALETMTRLQAPVDKTVVLCHLEPGAWNVRGGAHYDMGVARCPPDEEPLFSIGRTMFETDGVPQEWVERMQEVDEIWVPTSFNRDTFIAAGVKRRKLVVMPEPVDTFFFNPSSVAPIELPLGHSILPGAVREADLLHNAATDYTSTPTFRFLSVFKWEERKGWDVLLSSFLQEFSRKDNVELYLLTNNFHSNLNLSQAVTIFVHGLPSDPSSRPTVRVIDQHVPQSEMPRLYKAMDAFVLPSRGEGWGRPHVEAMAMGLPVLATNWSGPTAFLTEDNGYPVPITGMRRIPSGPFRQTHRWAEPSQPALRELMRAVVTDRAEAHRRGAQARRDMVDKFSYKAILRPLLTRLRQIQDILVEQGDLDD